MLRPIRRASAVGIPCTRTLGPQICPCPVWQPSQPQQPLTTSTDLLSLFSHRQLLWLLWANSTFLLSKQLLFSPRFRTFRHRQPQQPRRSLSPWTFHLRLQPDPLLPLLTATRRLRGRSTNHHRNHHHLNNRMIALYSSLWSTWMFSLLSTFKVARPFRSRRAFPGMCCCAQVCPGAVLRYQRHHGQPTSDPFRIRKDLPSPCTHGILMMLSYLGCKSSGNLKIIWIY